MVGFCSLRMDCTLDMAKWEVYGHPILQRIIAGLRKLYGEGDTQERWPITKDILLWLISRFDQTTFEYTNLYAAFCLAFAGFLRMGEFIYDKVGSDFRSWHLTCGSIFFQEDRLLLVLPASKIDPFRQGVILIILAACNEVCAMNSLRNLFEQFPKSHYHLLFSSPVRTFNRRYVIKKHQERINILGYGGNYTGHSFRRGAATSARLAGLFDKEIQLLGRWKSNSYGLYINTSSEWIHNVSSKHQRSQPPPLQIPPSIKPPPPPILTRTRSSQIPWSSWRE